MSITLIPITTEERTQILSSGCRTARCQICGECVYGYAPNEGSILLPESVILMALRERHLVTHLNELMPEIESS